MVYITNDQAQKLFRATIALLKTRERFEHLGLNLDVCTKNLIEEIELNKDRRNKVV